MRLSELSTGDRAVIVKVTGHGGFRKRIVEMGFIRGKSIEVLQSAPLQDPVKYRLMGYEVSLRHDEAAMIEVVSEQEAAEQEHDSEQVPPLQSTMEQRMHTRAMERRKVINVALVGNPNCGKTSLFNWASGSHEKVGNYSGVTVDAKEGTAKFEGYEFRLVDLPGTYSLSAYSPEELYVRREIIDKTPDIIINVIDASNLERNLYLTTQLIDMNVRMVCALNMYDEAGRRGDHLDHHALGKLFGVPMVPTIFKTGKGVNLLFHIIINMYEGVDFLDAEGNLPEEVARDIQEWHRAYGGEYEDKHEEDFAAGTRPQGNVYHHIHVNHGQHLEEVINTVQAEIRKVPNIRSRYSTRYLAIKLVEKDAETERLISTLPHGKNILAVRDNAVKRYEYDNGQDTETAMMDAKYGFIHGALHEAMYSTGDKEDTYRTTHAIDYVLTHKYVGIPIFIMVLYAMFQVTFSLGEYPMGWIEALFGWLGEQASTLLPDGPLKAMVTDGIIGGVGAVIVFLPQILILYAFISFMEDSGYMARAAFIMDKVMHRMGLHGKSFIPLIMGFGCNVPAVMSTRTIESRRSRLITMLILPFMSCSARLPIYIMIVGTFFAAQYRSMVMISLYVIGILMAVVMSRLFCRFLVRGEDTPFVMELPPYRFPTAKAMLRHTWEKGKQYLKKMGGIILVASIVVWALSYFPHNEEMSSQEQQEQSFIGRIGQWVEPVFRPQGFDWKLDVGLIAGVGAKEIVASTLGVLYSNDESVADDGEIDGNVREEKYEMLHSRMSHDGITPLTAYSFLLFVLLYFPCIATIVAIKHESGSWRWALFAACYTTVVAWVVSAAVYQIGSLF